MTEPPRRRIGDRLEEALEHRADVEGEIARGEADKPSRRSLVSTLAWLGVTGTWASSCAAQKASRTRAGRGVAPTAASAASSDA